MELKTYQPVEGQKEFAGVLTAFDRDSVTIEADGAARVFARNEVAVIRLALDF